VLHNVPARWKNPPISSHPAKAQFEERFLLTD
jgi:hypothetical protein